MKKTLLVSVSKFELCVWGFRSGGKASPVTTLSRQRVYAYLEPSGIVRVGMAVAGLGRGSAPRGPSFLAGEQTNGLAGGPANWLEWAGAGAS